MNKIKKIINKEFILYIIFGILTTFINIGLFFILNKIGIIYFIANLIALITAKTAAYFFNKFFVFKSKCKNKLELIKEILSFIFCRSITFLIDYLGLIFLVEIINLDKLLGKCIVTFIVIIINYILGRKYIFNHKKEM